MSTTLVDEGDIDAKWTFNKGGRVSGQFSSAWGGVLVASGDNDEDDDDFALQPISKLDPKQPESPVQKMTKVQLEFVSPKLREIAEDKDSILNSAAGTVSTCRDSVSSHASDIASPNVPKSPAAQDELSPMERARLALSKKELTKSARSQQKASLKKSIDTLAFTGSPLDL
ncbi:unnamed protein product [Cylindrotheca closterium]|uniref:Uncharacterized protein n=1 Tax=Cylindrotheca closterium TaxID=2856 RepID=A0AAD2CTS0_9STRA|nr:unnamed protein product [Cylindrotheca closterium]